MSTMTAPREADVCVVGAGLAGLTAARRLSQAGRSVVVLEARDRVGGRVWTQTTEGGVPVDMGGCFIGPAHDHMHALAKEMGVATFKTFVDGDYVLATGGKVRRYRGDIPRINPAALASAGLGDRSHERDGQEGARRLPLGRSACRHMGCAVGGRVAVGEPGAHEAGPRPRRRHHPRLLRLRSLRGLAAQLALPRPFGGWRRGPHVDRRAATRTPNSTAGWAASPTPWQPSSVTQWSSTHR